MIVCKFRLDRIEASFQASWPDGDKTKQPALEETKSLVFSAVVDGSAENKAFFRWTPSGQLRFDTVNGAAVKSALPGEDHYIFVVPARGFKSAEEALASLR